MAEWQSIDTAPRDGTRFLALLNETQHEIIAYDPSPRAKVKWKEGSQYGRGVWGAPTHWMPLPDLPTSSQDQGEKK